MRHEHIDRERIRRQAGRVLCGRAPAVASATPPAQDETVHCRRASAVIQAMPRQFRDALLLQRYELTYGECAAILGCAEGTVKSRLSRGRALLAAKLGH